MRTNIDLIGDVDMYVVRGKVMDRAPNLPLSPDSPTRTGAQMSTS